MDGDVENVDGDVSSGYVLKNRHTLYQCEYSSTFKEMAGYFESCNVSNGYCYMNIHNYLQHNV